MTYEFLCEKCGATILREMSMKDSIPKTVICPGCQANAFRVWGNTTIKIPEAFKATSEVCNGDNAANLDYIKRRMNHSRPSGKEKIYY